MSKNPLHSRLENLFSELEPEDTSVPPVQQDTTSSLPGWTWETDALGNFVACSSEVTAALGLSPEEFIGKPLRTFGLSPTSVKAVSEIMDTDACPTEMDIQYKSRKGDWVVVRTHIFTHTDDFGERGGWHGFNNVVATGRKVTPEIQTDTIEPETDPTFPMLSKQPDRAISGNNVENTLPIEGLWTQTGMESLVQQEAVLTPAGSSDPAAIAIPFQLQENQSGVIELVDESTARRWNEEERLLILEVTDQLHLALENAQLYAAAQRELQDRIKAEEEAERRTQELALINQVVSSVSASLDLRTSMQIIINQLAKAFSLVSGSISLLNQDRSSLTVIADYTKDTRSTMGLAISLDSNPAAQQVLTTRKTLILNDAQNDPMLAPLHRVFRWRGVQSVAILPLIVGKDVIGTVSLEIQETGRKLTQDEERLAETIIYQAAASIQNARLFEQTQTALAETELLYRISRSISQASTAQELVSLVVEYAMPKTAERVTLFMVEANETGKITELISTGFQEVTTSYQEVNIRLSVNEMGLLRELKGDSFIIPDIRRSAMDPASRQIFERMGMIGLGIVPLRTSGRLIGLLMVSARQEIQYTAQETRLLETVAVTIAVSLEKQRLLLEAQRRALELQTAAEIARDTSGTLALDTLLNRIVNMLSERFGFYHASIFLMDDSNTYAVVRESTGTAGEAMKRNHHKVQTGSRSIIGIVTSTAQSLVVNDVRQSTAYRPNPLLPNTRSELGIPLKIGDRVIGALDVQSTQLNAFTRGDVKVLEILADQITVAIENARAYELSQKAYDEMKEADRVKSQFLANMSHELRTPLNSIIGFSRVILKGIDGPVTDLQQQDLNAIYNSGQHLLGLINDILDLSKIEAGKMELSFEETNLLDMINGVMSTAIGLVKDKPIKLNKNIPADLPTVRADPMRVRQVLLNLLSNAAKFTDQGTITVTAGLQHSPRGLPEVIIRVIDTGQGIAAEDQGKLFQPFSQVDDSPTRKTGGTGLGLSICRSLIELHGGRIGIEKSELGAGSTFFITLPLPETDQVPASSEVSGDNPVLAIDDDMQVISLYERYLKPNGYTVVPLTDPAQAVARAKQIKPVAITLDVMMPNRDGWSVIKDLKSDPETKGIPVIMCSIQEEEEKGLSLGAADYLIKPFLQEDLVQAVNRINRDGTLRDLLIIDDDPADLRLVEKALVNRGQYRITTALGGVKGWEAIQAKQPDVIISDLFMPELNGFELLEKLRADLKTKDIPVIVLSGADLTPEQHNQLASLGQQMLSKGLLKGNDLLDRLDQALKHRKGTTSLATASLKTASLTKKDR